MVDVAVGAILPDMTVLIREGRIASVAPAAAATIPSDAERYDGRGKYMLPGLWDMHVHLSYATESALPILVANGVTGVRDLGSHFSEMESWRARIAAGELMGPRIVRAGPILNGSSSNRFQLLTGGPEQSRGIVRALKQVGVDVIKTHRRTPRADYFAIAEEAKAQGLRLVGHVPLTVSPSEASDAGQLFEHTETLFEGTFSAGLPGGAGNADSAYVEAIRAWRAGPAPDSLFARLVRNGTTVTPMLSVWRYLTQYPDTTFLADPRIEFIPTSHVARSRTSPLLPAARLPLLTRIYEEYRQTVRMMDAAGVTLLTGSDLSFAPWAPGFSLHDELAALVDAGLTPAEALRAATLSPARVMGSETDFGSVESGKIADLLILDANPLADIANTRRIAAVVVVGKLLGRAELDSLLRAGAELARRK